MTNPFTSFFARFRSAEPDDGTSRAAKLPSTVHAGRALELVADGATLVDVRESNEWRAGHAPRALHIPLAQISEQSRRISTERPVVVMCQSGSRSRAAAGQLRKAGFRATSLSGGIGAWQAAGGSVRSGR
jgi:rhodanese-related sulfurtransferase